MQEQLTAQLLFKLYRRGIWGGKHTPIKNLYHLVDKASIRESENNFEVLKISWQLILEIISDISYIF